MSDIIPSDGLKAAVLKILFPDCFFPVIGYYRIINAGGIAVHSVQLPQQAIHSAALFRIKFRIKETV